MHKLLTYPEVKTIFGWKSTTSIRRYVASGDLVRVQIGNGMNCFRITEESATAFLERLKRRADERTYLERAKAHTAHMREALPEPEVMLDADEIIRQSHIRTPEPTPKRTLDEVLAAKRDAEPIAPHRAASGLGFRTVRGI
jgi:hypothetical protein